MISLCERRQKSFDIIFQLPSLVQRRNDSAILQATVLLLMPGKSLVCARSPNTIE